MSKNIKMQQEDEDLLHDYVTMQETRKRFDKDLKILTEKVKQIMDKYHIEDNYEIDGHKIKVHEEVIKSVYKEKKSTFIHELLSRGKNYLVSSEPEIDVDTVYQEMLNGDLDKKLVEKYMCIVESKTLEYL